MYDSCAVELMVNFQDKIEHVCKSDVKHCV